jgi:hypothetical protein
MDEVFCTPQEYAQPQSSFDCLAANTRHDRAAECLPFQDMPELGMPLSRRIMEGRAVDDMSDGDLAACFGVGLDEAATATAEDAPLCSIPRRRLNLG